MNKPRSEIRFSILKNRTTSNIHDIVMHPEDGIMIIDKCMTTMKTINPEKVFKIILNKLRIRMHVSWKKMGFGSERSHAF